MSREIVGIPLVVAAPSGAGKTTACRLLQGRDPDRIVFSISHTTRTIRSGEVDGRDYHFVSAEVFDEMARDGAFLEWAEYGGNSYGTSWQSIEGSLAAGRDVLLEIEVQGARQVRERLAEARLLFLLPPSMDELEARLRGRGTDTDEQVKKRLEIARGELEALEEFDYAIVNDEIDRCVDELTLILQAERASETRGVRERFDPRAAGRRFRYSSPSI